MKKVNQNCVAVMLLTLLFYSCNKSEQTIAPIIANEALTTIQLQLTNASNSADVQIPQWEQLLNNEGNPLPADTSKAILNLAANSTYNCSLLIFDKTQNPPTNVSAEIFNRRNYHLEYYQPTPISPSNLIISNTSTDIPGTPTSATGPYLNLVVTRTDLDTNNPPLQVGLSTQFVTGAASTGRLRVVQRHQPNAKNGTYAPGSSDFDVNFTVNIK